MKNAYGHGTADVIIVKGFVPGVDFYPKNLRVKEPLKRIALSVCVWGIDKYPEERQNMYWLIHEFYAAVANCKFEVVCFYEEKRITQIQQCPRDNVIDEMRIIENGTTVGQIFGIPYFSLGGPWPYHDSATIEILIEPAIEEHIMTLLVETLKKNGMQWDTIPAVEGGPFKKTWLQRLLNMAIG
jgi:hypothetical protein